MMTSRHRGKMVNFLNPGIAPDIAASLFEDCGDGEQSTAPNSALAGLDATLDLSLNHRLAQGMFAGVVGGLDLSTYMKLRRLSASCKFY